MVPAKCLAVHKPTRHSKAQYVHSKAQDEQDLQLHPPPGLCAPSRLLHATPPPWFSIPPHCPIVPHSCRPSQAFRLHYCTKAIEPGMPECILDDTAYAIASWFCDQPESPYSVHNIAIFGVCKGKQVGSWFGPTAIALVLQELVLLHSAHLHQDTLRVVVAEHATLYKDQIEGNGNDWRSMILLIPVMLGASTYANPVYWKALLQCFHLPGFLGLRPSPPSFYREERARSA